MLETNDTRTKTLFQGEADQIQIMNLGIKDKNTRKDNAKKW